MSDEVNLDVTLGQLIGAHQREMVRTFFASNPTCPLDVLEMLSREPSMPIRSAVARNTATPIYLLKLLSADPASEVRQNVASNVNTPIEILKALVVDPSTVVAAAVGHNARLTIELFEQLVISSRPEVRIAAIQSKFIKPEYLASYSTDVSYLVRKAVAGHPQTPAEVLVRLASDDDEGVQRAVALNPNTPPAELWKMSELDNPFIPASLRMNPSTPQELLQQIPQPFPVKVTPLPPREPAEPELTITVKDVFAGVKGLNKYQGWQYWYQVAQSRDIDFSMVVGSLADVDMLRTKTPTLNARMYAASSERTPREELLKLARKGKPSVKSRVIDFWGKSDDTELMNVVAEGAGYHVTLQLIEHAAPLLSDQTWNIFASDEYVEVLQAVVQSPYAPPAAKAIASLRGS